MRIFSLATFFWLLLSSCNASDIVVSEKSAVRFEPTDSIAVQDLWHLVPPKHVYSNFAIIGFWQFSEHEIRRDGDWSLIGVVIGGVGDTAEVAIGANVWVKNNVIFLFEESKIASTEVRDATAIFGVPEHLCEQKIAECQAAQVRFVVRADGTVIADGKEIGSVEF